MNRRSMFAGLASLALGAAGPRETPLAEPRPSIENPRRIVVSLAEADPARANAVFSNIINVQSFYGQDQVRILVVAYGPGVRHLIAAESQVVERVQSLRAYDIEFVACGATLDALGLGPEAVIEGIAVVPNGLPEIIELSLQGWVHLRP
ncbi:DsrE family protein [Sediminicoccus sp. KRV36]|uniref:DsrE family protein n=1 Tax=Sediminicoccus sp. KRV36 TaxID=3133721 RepID=UPI00200BDA1F|nr:DsrE family protein [Sediminicoccus rosea]UPY35580.1 DsrE family protein [Sediminicoccus rosea]